MRIILQNTIIRWFSLFIVNYLLLRNSSFRVVFSRFRLIFFLLFSSLLLPAYTYGQACAPPYVSYISTLSCLTGYYTTGCQVSYGGHNYTAINGPHFNIVPGTDSFRWTDNGVCGLIFPTMGTTGSLSTISTTYGTASSSTSFSVSGANMLAGILVTPPTGFEVSLSSGGPYTATVTVGAAGTIAPTTVYVRLKATATASTTLYNSKNIVLTSTSATTVNISTTASGNNVTKASLTITANNQSTCFGTAVATVTGAAGYTATGFVNGETSSVISGSPTYTTTYTTSTAAGTAGVTITPALGTLTATNYSFSTFTAGTVTINAIPAAPTTTTPVNYCLNATATPLTATGSNLLWYFGGLTTTNFYTTAPTTVSGFSGNNYKWNFTALSAVTINSLNIKGAGSGATNVQVTIYNASNVSQGGSNTASISPTAVQTFTFTGGVSLSAGSYYFSMTSGAGSANILVFTGTDISADQSDGRLTYPNSNTGGNSGNKGPYYNINYTYNGTVSSSTAPTPSTTSVGTTAYSVSQTVNGCESAKTAITVNVTPVPTLTGASQAATVCAGSAATINLTGLIASSTSTVSYSINGVAQTAVTGVVANGSGAASFTTAALAAANNGQTLQITNIATTSCSQSFTQNVTLSVNPIPSLTGATQAATVCAGSAGTINLTGLLASSTSTINYTINGVAQTAVTGVVANASGAASFTTPALTASNNGQTLQVTGVTVTSATPNCSQSFTQNVTLAVNPIPTLTSATRTPVCDGSSSTINLAGLLANSTSTIDYTIGGIAQTAVTGVVANASGAASFTTPALTASNNGQTLQITGVTVTSATPNCSQSFTRNLTLIVYPVPTLSGASQAASVCAGSAATINLTGLLANTTFSVYYSINGVARTPITGVVSDASGAASFTSAALTAANNGQTLQITSLSVTSTIPNCTQSFTQNVTLSVNPIPTLTGASQSATVCNGSAATINLTGLLANSTSTISYTINGVAQTAVTGVVANASGAASFTTPALAAANNGQTLQVTGVTVTSATPNCSQSFTRNVTLSVNPTPTLTGASLAATVCSGSVGTINLTDLLASSTSTINYTINGVAQTAVTGVVANASGAASFTTPALTAANNGQTLQVTGVTVTSATPNCSQSFTQNVTLSVNPVPTLTGATQAAAVCDGSVATINLTGLLASSTSTINYTINGVAQTAVTGVVANASGAASFTTPALTAANNGQTLQVTGVTVTSTTPNCSQSFTQNVTLSVNPVPTLTGATQAAAVCDGSVATINLTGLLASSTSTISYTINGVVQTAVTGVVANASGAASFTTPSLTASNNGQTLQVTGVTVTSATPNCSQSFTRNVTLAVNTNITPAVSLTSSDADNTFCAGTSVTFTASGSNFGGGTASYNFKVASVSAQNSASTSYTTNGIANGQAVTVDLVVTGGTCLTSSSVTSNSITNTVYTPAVITTHPASKTVCIGTDASFNVAATGSNLTYQFRKGGVPISGATLVSYLISSVAAFDAGSYDVVISTNGACPVTSNTAILSVTNSNQWNGSVNTDWHVSGNWTCGVIPNANLDAIIPSSSTVILFSGNTGISKNLSVASGASLSMQKGSVLQVYGDWSDNGTFNPGTGKVEFKGNALAQTIDKSSGNKTEQYYKLNIDKVSGSTLISSTTSVDIIGGGTVNILSGQLDLNNRYFTLKSAPNQVVVDGVTHSVDSTARLGILIGTLVNTSNFAIERYISALTPKPRMLSTSVIGMKAAQWADSVSIFGGDFRQLAGFPATTSTLYRYDESLSYGTLSKGFVAITKKATVLPVGQGFRVLVGYDNYSTYTNPIKPAVTLKMRGAPQIGSLAFPVVKTGSDPFGWNMLGNPYPCEISWNSIYNDNQSTLSSTVAILDPQSSGTSDYYYYNAFTNTSVDPRYSVGVAPSSFGTSPRYNGDLIASSQGFFVFKTAMGSGSVNFSESQKVVSPGMVESNFRVAESSEATSQRLNLVAVTNTGYIDNSYLFFSPDAKAKGFDAQYDAYKFSNSNVTISTNTFGRDMAMNGVEAISTANMSIPVHITTKASGTHSLYVEGIETLEKNASVFLDDNYLHTTTELKPNNNQYVFNFSSDTATTAKSRFVLRVAESEIVTDVVDPNLAVSVSVYPNPSLGQATITMKNAPSGNYNIELIDTRGIVALRKNIVVSGGKTETSLENLNSFLDAGLYIVRITGGEHTYLDKLILIK